MAKTAAKQRGPGAGGRPKIDWGAALELFLGDPTLGYSDIARTFGVSLTAVRKHAKPGADLEDGWNAKRAEVVTAAGKQRQPEIVRALADRRADTIAVAEKLRSALLAEGAQVEVADALRALPAYAKLEELFAGEATDRVQIGEVKALVLTLARGFDREVRQIFELLPAGKRALALAVWKESAGRVIDEAVAGLTPLEDAA